MPPAEIITIGTEILLGEIVDTNSAYLARNLRDLNVDVFRTSTVGDNARRIADALQETLTRANIIITTGGLGPTVDDPTREAVALAFGVELEYRPELWDQIVERMQRFGRTPTENQKRQAYIPHGATAIHNPVGTAPAFIMSQGEKCVIALPGVPKEMEYLAENNVFPYLRERYALRGLIKARVLHTAGMGESVIDEKIGDLEALSNPTVGLAAHYAQVDIRITAKAESIEQADALIAPLEADLRARLGQAIFGADAQTLEQVTLEQVARRGQLLAAVEVGMAGALIQRLSRPQNQAFIGGQSYPALGEEETLEMLTRAAREKSGAGLALGIAVYPEHGQSNIDIVLLDGQTARVERRGYGGHPRSAVAWGISTALDILRLSL